MMSRIRPGLAAAPALVVSAAALLLAAADATSPRIAGSVLHPADLTVHEWGTFTSVAAEDGSSVDWDALGCGNDLPGFVKDFGYRGFKARVRGTVRMETPVMYFYSPREIEAHVKVAFPQGVITEWFPQADYEVYQRRGKDGEPRRLEPNLNGIDLSLRSVTGAIEWNHVTVQPSTAPLLPVEEGPSRYYAARETDAAPIAVGGQHEKFLFYRGVGRFPVPLRAWLSPDGQVIVENRGHEAVPNTILFQNRGGKVGYRLAGALGESMTLVAGEPPSLDGTLAQLRYDLENVLIEQGLLLKEAQAMVETWRDSWFEEGVRLIYIVPSRSIDTILPLRVDPAPLQTARVFVGRIELVTPDTTREVEEAIAAGDAATLAGYRRFLEPILARIEPRNSERADQAERLLRHLDESRGATPCR